MRADVTAPQLMQSSLRTQYGMLVVQMMPFWAKQRSDEDSFQWALVLGRGSMLRCSQNRVHPMRAWLCLYHTQSEEGEERDSEVAQPTWNWDDILSLGKHPGQGQLSCRASLHHMQ